MEFDVCDGERAPYMAMEKERKGKKCDKGKYIDFISSKSGDPLSLIGECEKSVHIAEKRRLQGKKQVCEVRNDGCSIV